ncbi:MULTISPECIES: hypothetical protein [unclassified Streptomyces]|uniref:hypothetical protein n=1 Tax=unclassified Streptomyces TaxID=2593676 RepID=UPI000DC4C6E6|nr:MULTISPECIES: hypothetical protein [unclassified Streptomyces]MYT69524.1 hypothetical protein [Streptomyces sp. SID8367]RAJ74073.1 hypothetical protein K377_06733 [Streptomyces sp. PsTaAH-137]
MRRGLGFGLLSGAIGVGLVATTAMTAEATTYEGGVSFSNVVFNDGNPIVVGTTNRVSVPLTFTVKSTSALDEWEVFAYRGTLGKSDYGLALSEIEYSCSKSTSGGVTTRACEREISIDPRHMPSGNGGSLVNSDATAWKTAGRGYKTSGSADTDGLSGTVTLQRYSRLTANASPEPAVKGKKITVTGVVQRADWSAHKYVNYGDRKVYLQFKPAGSDTYTSVKYAYASSTGKLSTTVTADKSGTWRWKYYGNSTTGASTSTGDSVTVG